MWPWKKKRVDTRSTPRIDLVKEEGIWKGDDCIGDFDIYVYLKDINGEPDLHFLETVDYIDSHWLELEKIARNHTTKLTPEHHIDSIDGTYEDRDFCLGFFSNEMGETVYLEFKNGEIVFEWAAD